MNEAVDVRHVLQNGVRDNLRPQYIGFEEVIVVVNRAGDMRLGGEVHNDIGLLDQGVDERRIADIAMPELNSRVCTILSAKRRQVVQAAGVGEQVQDVDAVVRIGVVVVVNEVDGDECDYRGQR